MRRVHSRYVRRVVDQPIGGRRVTIGLHVRRFRRTFAEQALTLAARSARRTAPLDGMLRDVALSLGGRPGARFAARRGTAVSRTTLIRLVRALPEPEIAAPAVLGVDDFALARGRRYGAVVVDLERHRTVDLLPERTAEAFAAWLAAHGQPQIICRDRGGDFATGGRRGAPHAVQVADRWHLLRNVGDALERVLGRHRTALRAAAAVGSDAPAESPVPAAPPDEPPPEPDRLARYAEAVALRAEGWSVSAIGRRVGASRPTVRKYVYVAARLGLVRGDRRRGEAAWEELARAVAARVAQRRPLGAAAADVAAFEGYLAERVGAVRLTVLHQRLRDEHGLAASYPTFYRYCRALAGADALGGSSSSRR